MTVQPDGSQQLQKPAILQVALASHDHGADPLGDLLDTLGLDPDGRTVAPFAYNGQPMTNPLERTPVWLPHPDLATVVELTPLVAIDLVVRDRQGRMLVGLRANRPAQGTWFVPGGRVGKNERLAQAFARISRNELGRELSLTDARPLGAFEHFYDDNFAGQPHFGTHYVVLAYALEVDPASLSLPEREQHGGYLWLTDDEQRARGDVHPNSLAYCGR